MQIEGDAQSGRRIPIEGACPMCGRREVVEVWQTLRAKPLGSHSLSGSQVKFSARSIWRYECYACGASGEATPTGDEGEPRP